MSEAMGLCLKAQRVSWVLRFYNSCHHGEGSSGELWLAVTTAAVWLQRSIETPPQNQQQDE